MSDLNQQALDYHEFPRPGKISVESSKPCATQYELSLAYTPGVAEPVRQIAKDPANAYRYTNKGNLVAVITDGTAILGLGNLGPLASKPVMEGKGILFKRFAGIDVFDIEVNAPSVASFIETVVNISPTFGGINLEDIAAPHCFEIEEALKARLDIPVFHDDQHGTAVVMCAGLLNALEVQGKKLDDVKLVCLGAGAAGLSCMRLLIAMGGNKANMTLVDSKGVIHSGRTDLNAHKQEFAKETDMRTLADAMQGADVFIGVSGPKLVSPTWSRAWRQADPVRHGQPGPGNQPRRRPCRRDDALMATGRSDYPNQVNNVLGFPYIFKGTFDARAKAITQPMMIAAAKALGRIGPGTGAGRKCWKPTSWTSWNSAANTSFRSRSTIASDRADTAGGGGSGSA
jgi:malate dehydrogenase (oxaloacetate-decarboxylating)(NADP+)